MISNDFNGVKKEDLSNRSSEEVYEESIAAWCLKGYLLQGILIPLAVTAKDTTTASDNNEQNEKDQNRTSVSESTANVTGHFS
jgi:hypothetical protein